MLVYQRVDDTRAQEKITRHAMIPEFGELPTSRTNGPLGLGSSQWKTHHFSGVLFGGSLLFFLNVFGFNVLVVLLVPTHGPREIV